MQGLDLHGLRGVWFEVHVVVQRHCRASNTRARAREHLGGRDMCGYVETSPELHPKSQALKPFILKPKS